MLACLAACDIDRFSEEYNINNQGVAKCREQSEQLRQELDTLRNDAQRRQEVYRLAIIEAKAELAALAAELNQTQALLAQFNGTEPQPGKASKSDKAKPDADRPKTDQPEAEAAKPKDEKPVADPVKTLYPSSSPQSGPLPLIQDFKPAPRPETRALPKPRPPQPAPPANPKASDSSLQDRCARDADSQMLYGRKRIDFINECMAGR